MPRSIYHKAQIIMISSSKVSWYVAERRKWQNLHSLITRAMVSNRTSLWTISPLDKAAVAHSSRQQHQHRWHHKKPCIRAISKLMAFATGKWTHSINHGASPLVKRLSTAKHPWPIIPNRMSSANMPTYRSNRREAHFTTHRSVSVHSRRRQRLVWISGIKRSSPAIHLWMSTRRMVRLQLSWLGVDLGRLLEINGRMHRWMWSLLALRSLSPSQVGSPFRDEKTVSNLFGWISSGGRTSNNGLRRYRWCELSQRSLSITTCLRFRRPSDLWLSEWCHRWFHLVSTPRRHFLVSNWCDEWWVR